MKNNWQTKKLGEVCDKASSNVSQNQLANENGTYPIYGASGFIKNVSFYHQDKDYVSIVKDGAGIGRLTLQPAYSSVIGTLQYLKPRENLNIRFFYYFLSSIDFLKYKNGSTIPHIYFKDYAIEPILVPSLFEQKRLVSIIDKVFEGIDKAKENAEKNLQNASELFESYLQNVFAKPGKGWDEKKLGEMCIVERGSSPRPIDKYLTNEQDGVNWIKIGDTKGIDRYLYKTKEKITKEGAKKSRFVKEDDFILTNSMSFGRPYIMKITGYIHDGWFVLRLNKNIENNYFYYLLISPYLQRQFSLLASGAIVKNISGDLVKKAIIPYPPLSEQKTIVAKLDALSAETKKLEAIYNQKLANLDELRKSVLKKAFSGNL